MGSIFQHYNDLHYHSKLCRGFLEGMQKEGVLKIRPRKVFVGGALPENSRSMPRSYQDVWKSLQGIWKNISVEIVIKWFLIFTD